jgi:endonuclease-8
MPEGDTVHIIASLLGPGLKDRVLTAVWVRGRDWPRFQGRLVTGVTSQGKHLYISLDDGSCLRSHLGLYGSWHRYRHGEPWRKPGRQASLVLAVDDWVYVCFNAREVQLTPRDGFGAQDQRARLGPDLARETPDPAVVHRRALELLPADTPVVDLLLEQRAACGIGNVYKSEVLFLTRLSPLLRIEELCPEDVADLYLTAARLIQQNLGGGPRVTREARDGRGNLWVYGRGGLPCLVCGTAVQRGQLGRNPRSTYWCPACQVRGMRGARGLETAPPGAN